MDYTSQENIIDKMEQQKKRNKIYCINKFFLIKFLYFLNDIGVIYQLDRIRQMDDNINDQNITYRYKINVKIIFGIAKVLKFSQLVE